MATTCLALLSLDDTSTGNNGNTHGAILIVAFDFNGASGVAENDTHIAAGNTAAGAAVDHAVDTGVSVRESRDAIVDISIGDLKAKSIGIGDKGTAAHVPVNACATA
jgi:hypothetical protein